MEAEEVARNEERLAELDKIKKRKMEVEAERAKRKRDQELAQKQKDTESYQEWEKQEEQFLLKQAKLRADIRIKAGRAKPIDILYKNINHDSDVDVSVEPPYKIFKVIYSFGYTNLL